MKEREDHSDPGARAAARLMNARRVHRFLRIGGAVAFVLLGLALTVTAEPLTGEPGATVGGAIAALLLVILALAVLPWTWTPAEYEHRQLESIWREIRADADRQVPWERYAAWAEAGSESVHLQLLRCAPMHTRSGGAPSPFSRQPTRRVDTEDVAAAAEAMEVLRTDAAELEVQAKRRHELQQAEDDQRRHEARLTEIERATASAIQVAEERIRRELAEQQASDRRAQADAVARALRRP
jgi:hypothetical protein